MNRASPWLGLLALLAGAGMAGSASALELFRLEYASEGPVVLVLGGIQGDEPGGFHAATLLATRYRVTEGRLWVAPALNRESILRRHRGLNGDLNRKFADLSPTDPDLARVQAIKRLVEHPDVAVVINLHDGSGFYHPQRLDALSNPARWGQSLVIDTADYPVGDSRLLDWAHRLVAKANRHLLPTMELSVKNTRTDEGDRQMQKALTWYALNQGRIAIASEASKELELTERVWTHLALVEAVLRDRGVIFDRDFNLARSSIAPALVRDLAVGLGGGRICLPLDDVRPSLERLPEATPLDQGFESSNPLLALRPLAEGYELRYGNARLSRLTTERLPAAEAVSIDVETAGRHLELAPCAQLRVGASVRLRVPAGYRVNAIGAEGRRDQDRDLALSDFDARYSIDRGGRVYRLEIYRGRAFAGLATLRFDDDPTIPPSVHRPPFNLPLAAGTGRRPENL